MSQSAPDPIDYAQIAKKRKGMFELAEVELDAFPPVSLDGRGRADNARFRDALFTRLEPHLPGVSEKVVGILTPVPTQKLVLVVYCKGRQVLLLTTVADGMLLEWLHACGHSMDSERGLDLEFTSNQTTVGRRSISAELLETNHVKLIQKGAPQSFNLAKLKKERDANLARLVRDVPVAPDDDGGTVAIAFAVFVEQRGHAAAPASNADSTLEALAEALGVPIPKSMAALYGVTDGGEGLFFGHDFLALAQLRAQWEHWNEIYESWPWVELVGDTRGQPGLTYGLYACPRRIPFVDLVGGNHLAVDLLPGPAGTPGQIVVAGRDIDTISVLAAGMAEFLDLCRAFDGSNNVLESVFTQLQP